MRHLKSGRKLNCNSSHRLAMFRNMSMSLIFYEKIKTTLYKAKELQRFLEPIITISKYDSVSNRRLLFSRIPNKFVILKLFNNLGPKFLHRKGGYTSIIKCGYRFGDSTLMSYIRFVF